MAQKFDSQANEWLERPHQACKPNPGEWPSANFFSSAISMKRLCFMLHLLFFFFLMVGFEFSKEENVGLVLNLDRCNCYCWATARFNSFFFCLVELVSTLYIYSPFSQVLTHKGSNFLSLKQNCEQVG